MPSKSRRAKCPKECIPNIILVPAPDCPDQDQEKQVVQRTSLTPAEQTVLEKLVADTADNRFQEMKTTLEAADTSAGTKSVFVGKLIHARLLQEGKGTNLTGSGMGPDSLEGGALNGDEAKLVGKVTNNELKLSLSQLEEPMSVEAAMELGELLPFIKPAEDQKKIEGLWKTKDNYSYKAWNSIVNLRSTAAGLQQKNAALQQGQAALQQRLAASAAAHAKLKDKSEQAAAALELANDLVQAGQGLSEEQKKALAIIRADMEQCAENYREQATETQEMKQLIAAKEKARSVAQEGLEAARREAEEHAAKHTACLTKCKEARQSTEASDKAIAEKEAAFKKQLQEETEALASAKKELVQKEATLVNNRKKVFEGMEAAVAECEESMAKAEEKAKDELAAAVQELADEKARQAYVTASLEQQLAAAAASNETMQASIKTCTAGRTAVDAVIGSLQERESELESKLAQCNKLQGELETQSRKGNADAAEAHTQLTDTVATIRREKEGLETTLAEAKAAKKAADAEYEGELARLQEAQQEALQQQEAALEACKEQRAAEVRDFKQLAEVARGDVIVWREQAATNLEAKDEETKRKDTCIREKMELGKQVSDLEAAVHAAETQKKDALQNSVELERKYKAALATLTEGHAAQLNTQQQEHAGALIAAKGDVTKTLTTQHGEAQVQLQRVHAEAQSALQKEHATAIETLKNGHATQQSAVQQEIDACKQNLAELGAKLAPLADDLKASQGAMRTAVEAKEASEKTLAESSVELVRLRKENKSLTGNNRTKTIFDQNTQIAKLRKQLSAYTKDEERANQQENIATGTVATVKKMLAPVLTNVPDNSAITNTVTQLARLFVELEQAVMNETRRRFSSAADVKQEVDVIVAKIKASLNAAGQDAVQLETLQPLLDSIKKLNNADTVQQYVDTLDKVRVFTQQFVTRTGIDNIQEGFDNAEEMRTAFEAAVADYDVKASEQSVAENDAGKKLRASQEENAKLQDTIRKSATQFKLQNDSLTAELANCRLLKFGKKKDSGDVKELRRKLNQLQAEKRENDANCQDAQKQLTACRAETQTMRQKVQSLEKMQQQLSREKDDAMVETSQAQQNADQSQARINALAMRLLEYEADDDDDLDDDLNEEEPTAAKEKPPAVSGKTQVSSPSKQQGKKKAKLPNNMKQLKKTIGEMKKHGTRLGDQKKKKTKRSKASATDVKSLESKVKALTAENAHLTNTVAARNGTIQTNGETLKQKNQVITQAQNDYAALLLQKTSLENELATSRAQMKDVSSAMRDVVVKMNERNEQVTSLQSALTTYFDQETAIYVKNQSGWFGSGPEKATKEITDRYASALAAADVDDSDLTKPSQVAVSQSLRNILTPAQLARIYDLDQLHDVLTPAEYAQAVKSLQKPKETPTVHNRLHDDMGGGGGQSSALLSILAE